MATLTRLIFRFRLFIILLTVVVSCLALYPYKFAVIVNNPDDWVNPDHDYVKLNKEIEYSFGGANVINVMVSVLKGDIFTTETLAKIKRISDELSLIPGCINPNLESISAGKSKYMKAINDMVITEQLLPKIPDTEEGLARVREGCLHNPLIYGRLVSHDKKSALIMADYDSRQIAITEIYKRAKDIKEKETDSNHIVRIAGKPVQMGWTQEQQASEMPVAFLALLVVCLVILYLAFRNVRGMFLPVTIGLLAGLFGMAWVPILGYHFNIMSWGAPFILLVAGICHCVQFLRRYEEEGQTHDTKIETIQATLTELLNPILLTVFTDSLGFVVIMITPFENLKPACVAITGGLLWMLWLVVFFMPAILFYLHIPSAIRTRIVKRRQGSKLSRIVGQMGVNFFSKWNFRTAVFVFVVVGSSLGFLVSEMYVGGFDWDTALFSNIAGRWKKYEIYKDQQKINDIFSGSYPYNILIRGKKDDVLKDYRLMTDIEALEEFLKNRDEISYALSVPDYLAGMNMLMHGGNPEYLKVAHNSNLNAQYYFLLTGGYPGEFETVADTVTWRNTVVKCMVSSGNPLVYDKLVSDTKKWIEDNWHYESASPELPGGFIGVLASMSEDARNWLLPTLLVLIFLVYVITGAVLKHPYIPIILILPLLLGLVVMLGPLQYLTMSGKKIIDYGNQQFISLSIGTGIDGSIYLLMRCREGIRKGLTMMASIRQAWETTGVAVIFSGAALIFGYIPLMFVKTYWAYLALGSAEVLMLNMLGTLILIPVLLGFFHPKFKSNLSDSCSGQKVATG